MSPTTATAAGATTIATTGPERRFLDGRTAAQNPPTTAAPATTTSPRSIALGTRCHGTA